MKRDPEKAEGRLIRRCLAPAAGVVLEVGCGDGRLSAELAGIADTLVAIDPIVAALAAAKGRVGAASQLVAASGQSLPLSASSVDTVVFTLSLHHQDPRLALGEARRVLNPGGRILVLEPATDPLMTHLFAVLDDESEAYRSTEAAINASGLEALDTGAVGTRWEFEDFAEMVDYLFDHFGLAPHREGQARMADLLADRRDARPLTVGDVTRFWLLGEAGAAL